ncbi:LVIVD repeat-containing protein [Haladaptatus sp. DYSN1]|uniref:LVIVD repeat-containing protein n=1 Tax=unclassified Haladaptatus TaxID=2622732 RepID=UPI0024065C93|nr:hypothetical protein [Haladaptatus sp. DYSN1]
MAYSNSFGEATRRTVLKATAGALGVAAVSGTAAASDGEYDPYQPETIGKSSDNVSNAGYHSMGAIGSESTAGRPENPHYGGITEVRVHGDYAFVGLFSSRDETDGRGVAIVDISDYNRAETEADLDQAEMTVLSFFGNQNPGTAIMDVKVSADGNYLFLGTQPITALFGELTTSTDSDADSTSGTNTGGVVAVDVTDKGNPTIAGTFDAFTTGIHNLFHHRIGGNDYVFACKDIEYAGDAGMYVFEFHRDTGLLELVNRWTVPEEPNTDAAPFPFFYCHDVEVQDDPKTGTPTAYLSYWDAGLQVLDVSDPTSITRIGRFEMRQAHFATPAPDLVDGKRVCIASHEEPSGDYDDGMEEKSNPKSTGTVFLVDADGIYEDPSVTTDLPLLDDWTWQNATTIEGVDDIEFTDFALSPHNSTVEKHVDPRSGAVEFYVHQAHYHGGLRYLNIDTGDWSLVETGWSRPQYDVPEASMMEGLNATTPNIWGADVSNGVTFAADINQGIHAIYNTDLPISGATPVVALERSDDGSVFTGGQTDHVTLKLQYAESDVLIRDRLPESWTVADGDDHTTYLEGGGRMVEFTNPVSEADPERNYFAEVPSGAETTGDYTFGPVEFSHDGGDTWHEIEATTEVNTVSGTSTNTNSLTLGTIGGAAGVFYHQREKVLNTVRGVFGDE